MIPHLQNCKEEKHKKQREDQYNIWRMLKACHNLPYSPGITKAYCHYDSRRIASKAPPARDSPRVGGASQREIGWLRGPTEVPTERPRLRTEYPEVSLPEKEVRNEGNEVLTEVPGCKLETYCNQQSGNSIL
jgi:hypothetical protein